MCGRVFLVGFSRNPEDRSSEEKALPQVSRSRKRWYFLIVSVILIAVAFASWSMLPGEAEAVTLGLSYVEGEEMTYELEMAMEMMGTNLSFAMTYTMEVLDVEDEMYTVRTTFSLMEQTFSLTTRINQTGHTVEFLDAPPEFEQSMSYVSFMPGNGFYFPGEMARVGDSWQIPVDMRTEQFNLTGTMDAKITETGEITVQAGTYEVFKLEISSDVRMVAPPPEYANVTEPIGMNMTMEGYEYFEKGTCRVIEAKIEMTMDMSMMGMTVSIPMTLNMELTEHILPPT